MGEKEVQDILIKILFSTLNETELDVSVKEKLTPDILVSLYHLSQKHDLSHILSMVVYRNGIDVEQKLRTQLQREELLSIYRCERIRFALAQICEIFNKVNIAYVPLKGSVIRPYYPVDNMRTSCDIDILIHENDIDVAVNALQNAGYRYGDRNYHDISLFSPNQVHLELHFTLQENRDNLDIILKDAWKYAVLTNACQYGFTNEFFVFHMFAHMAYHFISGGCGIRSLMDIWVMEHKMGITYADAEDLLKKANIYQFAKEISHLATICFSRHDGDEFYNKLLSYIFKGGVYGSTGNQLAIKKLKANNTVQYVFKRLFMPYKSMVILFPILKKIPILLPFCWVIRWISMLCRGKSTKILFELTYVNNISDDKINEVEEICFRLGI